MTNKNILCIDPGTGGGFTWNIGDSLYSAPMKPMPTGTKGLKATLHQPKYVEKILDVVFDVYSGFDNTKIDEVYIEQVGTRFGDTPKTSWSLSMNYHVICMYLSVQFGKDDVHYCLPTNWQQQLPFGLPSGKSNYGKRKKLLQEFAEDQYPLVTQLSFDAKDNVKLTKNKRITAKTADAACLHWIYSGKSL